MSDNLAVAKYKINDYIYFAYNNKIYKKKVLAIETKLINNTQTNYYLVNIDGLLNISISENKAFATAQLCANDLYGNYIVILTFSPTSFSFDGLDLSGIHFKDCITAEDISFVSCNLSETKFTNANFGSVEEFFNNDVENADFSGIDSEVLTTERIINGAIKKHYDYTFKSTDGTTQTVTKL